MKIGLYSIAYLGCWYRGEALTLPEVIRTAKEFGYDGVEIDGKRPHGNPLDWPKARCQELQRLASGEGIEIHGVAANNDFSNPVPEVREAQICFVRELIRMTAAKNELSKRRDLPNRLFHAISTHPVMSAEENCVYETISFVQLKMHDVTGARRAKLILI